MTVAALSLGPSFAHVLEAVPRLTQWSPELWRETTVFNRQFAYFAYVGAPLDLGAIACLGILAYLLRGRRPAFSWAAAGFALYVLALIVWFAWVRPANLVMATWTQGPIPADFDAVRTRWETGHMAVTAAKFFGFVCLACGVVTNRRA